MVLVNKFYLKSKIHTDNATAEIDLSKNSITKLDKDVFTTEIIATRLDLSENIIEKIEINTFRNCYLTVLNLSCNKIDSIEDESFQELSNLINLDLSYNKLKQFNFIHLKYLKKLKYLNLNNNELDSLEFKFFSYETIDLEELYLSGNKINNIERKNFNLRWAPYLKKLDLTLNCMTLFDTSLLEASKELEILKLDLSKLSSFDYNGLPFKFKVNILFLLFVSIKSHFLGFIFSVII
jgi:insulin-like growth factor-binding protein complex acid labile subunit